ncbi:MAG: GIY-YIG nuclease family protein [Eubacteriaceae bacterium]|nr:GIY-YIG nuclease family protein [Eubacteriaceae bacterium]
MYYVYMLRCADDTLYTGITTDLNRRLKEHNSGVGSKYTRARLPVAFAYFEEAADKSTASKRESTLKKLVKRDKELLCAEERIKNTEDQID